MAVRLPARRSTFRPGWQSTVRATLIAGNGRQGGSGTQLNYPNGLAVDGSGNLYVGDGARVRMISPSGVIISAAGTGTLGYSGDGGPATRASGCVGPDV